MPIMEGRGRDHRAGGRVLAGVGSTYLIGIGSGSLKTIVPIIRRGGVVRGHNGPGLTIQTTLDLVAGRACDGFPGQADLRRGSRRRGQACWGRRNGRMRRQQKGGSVRRDGPRADRQASFQLFQRSAARTSFMSGSFNSLREMMREETTVPIGKWAESRDG